MTIRMTRSFFAAVSLLSSVAAVLTGCSGDTATPPASGGQSGNGAAGRGGGAGTVDTGTGGASPVDGSSNGGRDAGGQGRNEGGGSETGPTDPAPVELYVGCADPTGTVLHYSLGPSGMPMSGATVMTGGAVSNAELNDSEDRVYVAHQLNGEAAITTYARDPTTGSLTRMGMPVADPFVTPGTAAPADGGPRAEGGAISDGGRADGASGPVDSGLTDGGPDAGEGGAVPTTMYANPQTLTFDRTRRFLVVPNYAAGNVYVYQMAADGAVGSLVSSHAGGIFAHNAVFTLNNKFVFVPYLGSNIIQVYSFDSTSGAIRPTTTVTMPLPMTGPRHLALHPNGQWLYVIDETVGGASTPSGSVDLFAVDQTAGALSHLDTFAVPLPSGYAGLKNGSEIVIAPSSDVLYVSMRLDNMAEGSIVGYRINSSTGALTLIKQESTRGITPRQFSISRDGRIMAVGNQNSNTMALFRVDPASGDFTYVAIQPVCTSPRFARFAATH